MAARIGLMLAGITALGVLALTLSSCQPGANATATGAGGAQTTTVTIGGERFTLELALDFDAQQQGLGGRESIDRTGGMLFVFPSLSMRYFVMRDCVIPIDIAYVDDGGRIVSMYTMEPEKPRDTENETQSEYEGRLRRYSSQFPVRYVIEVAGGRLQKLGVAPGTQVRLNHEELKRLAQSVDR